MAQQHISNTFPYCPKCICMYIVQLGQESRQDSKWDHWDSRSCVHTTSETSLRFNSMNQNFTSQTGAGWLVNGFMQAGKWHFWLFLWYKLKIFWSQKCWFIEFISQLHLEAVCSKTIADLITLFTFTVHCSGFSTMYTLVVCTM